MSGRWYWRPGDGRSLRRDRVPMDMRLLGRIVPSAPRAVSETHPGWMSLARLDQALVDAFATVSVQCPVLADALRLSNGHHPELATLPFGGLGRELLSAGLYVITDASPLQRVLYVGSSCDGTVRGRLISHLFDDGRLHHAQRGVRRMVLRWQSEGFPETEEADAELRQVLWGRNRWFARPDGLGGSRQLAAELVSSGAFDIATVRVPSQWSIVARCLERYATELIRAETGWFPPLNDSAVVLDKRVLSEAVTPGQAKALFTALDWQARRLHPAARHPHDFSRSATP